MCGGICGPAGECGDRRFYGIRTTQVKQTICRKHPNYKGVHKPKVNCKECRDIYNGRNKTSNSS